MNDYNKRKMLQVSNRIKEVLNMLADGHSRREIINKIGKKYDISDTQVDNYIKRARKSFDKVVEERAFTQLETVLSRLDRIYNEAMAAGNFKAALDAQVHIARLSKLDPAKKVESDVSVTDKSDLSDLPTAELLKLQETAKGE